MNALGIEVNRVQIDIGAADRHDDKDIHKELKGLSFYA